MPWARFTRLWRAISPASPPAWAWRSTQPSSHLLIGILLMFLLHQLQLIQERLVLDTQHYCDQELLRNLRTRNSRMSVLLELNDWQLSCFDSNANCFYQQAAAAVADDGGLVFGNAALAQSRRKPQSFNGQYLSNSIPNHCHNPSDRPITTQICHHQLQDLRQHSVSEVAVAAPAHYSDEQLGLLLGIASEAGIAIKGVLSTARPMASQSNGRYQLLDIGMNLCLSKRH